MTKNKSWLNREKSNTNPERNEVKNIEDNYARVVGFEKIEQSEKI